MYERLTLSKDPKIARRLLDIAYAGGLDIDERIASLALENIISQENFVTFPLELTSKQIEATQFIRDRNGRCLVLDSNKQARDSLLAHVWLENAFPLLIVVNKKNQDRWLDTIERIWPDKKINIFGDHRPKESRNNVSFTLPPELDCDIYITKAASVYDGELMKKTRFRQVIIDHVLDSGSTPHHMVEKIQALCKETVASAIVIHIRQVIRRAKENNVLNDEEVFDKINWEGDNIVFNTLRTFLYQHTSCDIPSLDNHERTQINLKENGFGEDKRLLLPIMNICDKLIK